MSERQMQQGQCWSFHQLSTSIAADHHAPRQTEGGTDGQTSHTSWGRSDPAAEQCQCCLCSRYPPVSYRQLADVEAVLALQVAVAALQQLDAAVCGIQLHLQGEGLC